MTDPPALPGRSRRRPLAALCVAVLALLTFAAATTPAVAARRAGTSLTVQFTNSSNRDLRFNSSNYNGCAIQEPQVIAAGGTVSWTLQACGDPRGNVGTFSFALVRDSGLVQVGWDAPVVGANTYTESAPAGYVISHSGGDGVNATVRFTFDCNSKTCDGIADSWKQNGVYIDPTTGNAFSAPGPGRQFVDLPGMGADVNRADLFVQVDWMADATHSHALAPQAIRQVVDAFANAPYQRSAQTTRGINLHVDAGPDSILNVATGTTWGTLSRAAKVTEATNLGTAVGNNYQWDDFNKLKMRTGGFVASGRSPIFHYAVSAHNLQPGSTSSGIAPTPGSDLIVSLGSFADKVGTVAEQAGTFMHELGHNLGLEHGGNSNVNNKPQYFSVMNYLYQFGLISGTTSGIVDFSRQNTSLDENGLQETQYPSSSGTYDVRHFCPNKTGGGGSFVTVPAKDAQVDWNCDGKISQIPVAFDVNDDGAKTVLGGHDDWGNILLRVGSIARTGSANGVPAPTPEDELTPELAAMDEPLDTTPPVTTARTDPRADRHGVYHSDVHVTLDATDDVSGVALTEYDLDGAGWMPYTDPVTVSGDGKHRLLYRSVDHAQNQEQDRRLFLRIDCDPAHPEHPDATPEVEAFTNP
ncbi:hypothetical protein GCM10009665_54150 [Kitasatospora nipponensis]|uniref:Reprolysin-like metallo-peptidase family M12B n=2 Tax=Kitasatospora nipponensis TaxID=258049 RepID=A0ABP4HAX1_9ACTN